MLQETMDMIRTISQASRIKIKRNYSDFLKDRIIQATSESTLSASIEKLIHLLDADTGEIWQPAFVSFIKTSKDSKAAIMLCWLREYPDIAAMIIMLKKDDYFKTIESLSLPDKLIKDGIALPSREPQIKIKILCLSPLTHGSDIKSGNATLFRRMGVLTTNGSILSLPFYAGNAFRGQMRDLLADDFLRSIGLIPRRDIPPVELWFFHALYAGGALQKDNSAQKQINKHLGKRILSPEGFHDFRDNLPALSLLGSALGNRILSGRVNFPDFRPSCKQWGNGDIDVAELFEWIFLTRREDHEEYNENSGMIANTECLRLGTTLLGGIDPEGHISELEMSALGRGLELLSNNGYIGAQNRSGQGSVSIEIENLPDSTMYINHLKNNQENIKNYLLEIGAIDVHS